MRDIDDIIIGYIESIDELGRMIKEKAKGDWSKLPILTENDTRAAQLIEKQNELLQEFREATSLGTVFVFSSHLDILYRFIENRHTSPDNDLSIEYSLENIRDMIEDMNFDPEDGRIRALNELLSLPRFSPDDWAKRKYTVSGLSLPLHVRNIPKNVVEPYKESCYSYMYGNFMASIALARAVLEMTLKNKFPSLANTNLRFDEIIDNIWRVTRGFKNREDMRKKAHLIRRAGNQAMHRYDDKVTQIFNEMTARIVLDDLKSLIEFLYT